MSSSFEQNPFAAYLAHLAAVPLGIYKTGYGFSTGTQISTFSSHPQNTDCGIEITFQSTKSAEPGHFETPFETLHGLKSSEEAYSNLQLPATHLTFSSLSSAVHSGDIISRNEASQSCTARSDTTFDDISPDLWRKISRISALLQNVGISMSQARNSSESSKFMSQLSESNAPSSSFDTSLGSFSTSMRSSELKQIANMLDDVIDASLRSRQSDGAPHSDNRLNREVDELVAQYNSMAAFAISSGAEVPIITTNRL